MNRDDMEEPFIFTYLNHRGELSERRAIPIRVRFGSNEWHSEPQWLMLAMDIDRGKTREFAMKYIGATCALCGGK